MFGDLNELRLRPIPSLESVRALKRRYADWPIEKTNALHDEKLVRAETFGLAGRNHYAHANNPPYWAAADGAIDALLLRESVARRLANVDSRLKQSGLKLFLYDAWRPRALQAFFHDVWVPGELKRRRPELSDVEIATETERYWAAPSVSADKPAPHATGGAVDLTIVLESGVPLWMGSLFDDASAISATDRFEDGESGDFSFSDDEARANRRLLYWLMTEEGFGNHPDEWWHYCWGDQMWAKLTGRDAAVYGLAEPSADLLT